MTGIEMKINTQPPETYQAYETGQIDVVSMWSTIQGEGPHAGRPAVFLRLAGCNLKCPLCDTDYTSNRRSEAVEEIVIQLEALKPPRYPLVVITGGEPFRQPIFPLVKALIHRGWHVQIETNGTMWRDSMNCLIHHPQFTVVCSPKTSTIHPGMANGASAWKYVLDSAAVDETDGLPMSALGMKQRPARPTNDREIYIQPLDSKDELHNRRHQDAAVDSAQKFGYRLCLQIQKIVGVD